ncbi:hypothetical protein D3C78_886570 [compost metagenome]
MLRGLRCHHATGLFRSRQRRTLDARIGDNVRDLIRRNKQIGPGTVWRTRLAHQMFKGLSAVRHDASVFRDHWITRGEVRRQDAHKLIEREIPRLNGHHHADRVMFNPRIAEFRFIGHRSQKLLRIIRVITGDLRTEFHLAAALLDQFPHLLTGDFRQFFRTAVDQIGKFMQHRKPLGNIPFRPFGMVKRIGGF